MKIIIVFLSSVVIVLIASFLAYRLLPESSVIAETQTYVLDNDCRDCHTISNYSASDSFTAPDFIHPEHDVEATDLEAYFEAVKLTVSYQQRRIHYSNTLLRGEQLARKYFCFNCHGLLGQGGYVNKGSLKGYIPGWFGRDFDILTDKGNPDVLREWILTGSYQKIIDEPVLGAIARYYLEKQETHMLEFSDLADDEIQTLVQYVLSIRQYGAMRKLDVHDYKKATMRK